MKEPIFVNPSVQPESFCSVYLISTEQQIWPRGWAVSSRSQLQLFTPALSHIPSGAGKATITPGNPQVPPAKCPLQGLTRRSQRRRNRSQKTHGHWEFEIPEGWTSPISRRFCPKLPGSPNSTFLPQSY